MTRVKTWRPDFDRKAPKVWDPEKAARFPRYPQTPEAYEAMRQRSRETILKTKPTRAGVPDGYSGKRDEVLAAKVRAADEGAAVGRFLLYGHNGGPPLDDPDDLAGLTDEQKGNVVLGEVFGTYRDGTAPLRDRLDAARLFLRYTVPQPKRGAIPAETAEAFLEALAERVGLPPGPPLRK